MESVARQRQTTSTTAQNEKTGGDVSRLERGESALDDGDARTRHSPADENSVDPKDENEPPLTKSSRFKEFNRRLRGKHLERIPTVLESLIATFRQSWLNLALVFVVLSWVSHFAQWDERAIFVLSFLALIPLEKLLQFVSHQSMLYLGHSVGDLVNITLMNAIEAILAILLLRRDCELKLLQSTIIGVILLQLLLVPGVMFLAGGTRIKHQELHLSQTQLNQSMMTMGVMCMVIPAAYFAGVTKIGATSVATIVTDDFRDQMLKISRGMAIIMLLVYIGSRIYLVNPPGEDNAMDVYAAAGGHEAFREAEENLKTESPKIGPWFCFFLLIVLVAIIAVTAEWLVHSIEFVRHSAKINEEWFGLVLLPLVSFSGDGIITFSYAFRKVFFHHGKEAHPLADAKPIDLSIQFALFWTPLLVLIGWWTNKPLPLLFDIFEIVILVAAVFVVNYITADAKTNWAEGWMMICFFAIIALVAWFYPGQEYMEVFFPCVLAASEGGHGTTGEAVTEGATTASGEAAAAATTSHAATSEGHKFFF